MKKLLSILRLRPIRRIRLIYVLFVIFVLLPLFYLVNHYKPTAEATWYDDSFAYRKKITIGNSGAAVSSARKVLIEVDTATLTTDKMQADCDDTRFTDINGKVLRFAIDVGAGACDTSSTDYYVELPNVTTGDNIIYMYYGNPAATSRTTPSLLGPSWTREGSAPMPVASYQPVGAASLAASYSNLNNPGTNDAATGVAPTFAAATGWTFNGSTQYLTTGVVPASTWSAIVRFSGGSLMQGYLLGNFVSGTQAFYIVTNYTDVGRAYNNGGQTASTGVNSGVMAIAEKKGYLDGSFDVNLPAGGSVPTTDLYIGAVDLAGAPLAGRYWSGNVQAIAIYNSTLTSAQVSAITTAMNALSSASDAGIATFSPTSGPTLASEEKTPGPAAYWRFDDGQGTTAQDSTVNNKDGTVSGATWTEESRCIFGKCLQFDGSNDYVDMGNTLSYESTQALTMSAWIRSSGTGTYQIMGKQESSGNFRGYFLQMISGNIYCGVANSGAAAAQIKTNATYNNNLWHHVECSYTGSGVASNFIIYIDGVAVATTVAQDDLSGTIVNSVNFEIGGRGTTGAIPFPGFIDEPKIYPYARSAAQVKADFAKGGAKGGGVLGAADQGPLSNGLVGYWKMDETAANSCTGGANDSCDSSGNSNDGAWNADATTTATGKFGRGTTYDGTGDYISVTQNDDFDFSASSVTVTAWVKLTDTSAARYIVAKAEDQGNNQDFKLLWHPGFGQWHFQTFGGGDAFGTGATATLSHTPVAGQWYFIVAYYDYANKKVGISLNDQAPSTTNGISQLNNSTSSFHIGKGSSNSSSDMWYGQIDEARVYRRVLSPAEIQQLYNFAPNPVMHLKMDEKTGTNAYDTSGSGNNGSVTEATWTNGKFGSALRFDGTNDTVNAGDIAAVDGVTAMTASAWVKPIALADLKSIISKFSSSGGTGWIIETGTGGLGDNNDIVVAMSGSEYGYTTADVLTVGTWTYITMVFDGSQTGDANRMKAYADGKPLSITFANPMPASVPSTAHTVRVNATTDDARYLNTDMDDVKIYNYARSQKQIVEDMNAGHPAPGSPIGSAVAHWKLDDMQGTTAQDSSTNNNDLTLNSVSWTRSGKINYAWNGTNAVWLSRSDDADFDVSATDDYSISGWVKSDSASNPAATEYVVNKADGTTAGYAVYFNTSGNLCFGIDDDTTWGPDIASCTSADFYDAGWHHFSAVRDYSGTDKTYMYVDGIQRDSDSDSTTVTLANSLSLYVGDRDGTDNGDEFAGDIDEVKIYRGALSVAEVRVDMNVSSSIDFGAKTTEDTGSAPVGEWKMDEKTGSSIFDTSGNGNTGTITEATWTTGKIGSALSFDGSNDVVKISDNAALDPTGTSGFSLSTWVYFNSTSGSQRIVDKYGNETAGYSLGLGITTQGCSDGFLCFRAKDDSARAVNVTIPSSGAWHHLVGVLDPANSKIRLYIDGVEAGNATAGTGGVANTADPFCISGGSGSGDICTDPTSSVNGKIDNIRLYNYARTPAQVAWEYNRGGPVGHWQLDECQGPTAYDKSGNAYNGTITIGATGTQDQVGNCTSADTGDAWYNGATGKFNSSLSFDGTDDYITLTGSAFSVGTGSRTNTAWVKTSTSAIQAIYYSKGSGQALNTFYVLSDGKVRFNIRDDNGVETSGGTFDSTRTVNDGNWHFVTGVWDTDANAAYIYIDGTLNATASSLSGIGAVTDTNTKEIGRDSAGGNEFNGLLDDVRVYNYALTAAQIKNVMNQGSAVRYGPNTGSP